MTKYKQILTQVIDKQTFLKYLESFGHAELRDLILYKLAKPLDEVAINKTLFQLGMSFPTKYELEYLAERRDYNFFNEGLEEMLEQIREDHPNKGISFLGDQKEFPVEIKSLTDERTESTSRGVRFGLLETYLKNIELVERKLIQDGTRLIIRNNKKYRLWLEREKKGEDPRNNLYDDLGDFIDQFAKLFNEAGVDLEDVKNEITSEARRGFQSEFASEIIAGRPRVANSNEFFPPSTKK